MVNNIHIEKVDRENKRRPDNVDSVLTAEAPLSRVAQFARHEAAAE